MLGGLSRRWMTGIQADLVGRIRVVTERLDDERRRHGEQLGELSGEDSRIRVDLRSARKAPWLDADVSRKELLRQKSSVAQERRRLVNAHRDVIERLQDRLFELLRQFEAVRGGGGDRS